MDLRRNLAAQQIYREQIYEKINTPKSAGKRPNAACVLAIVCATRANDQLVKQLKGALAEFDMDFLLDFTRAAFKYDGLFVYDANKGDAALHMIPMDLFNLGSTETGNVSIFHENYRLENSNDNNGEGRLSDVGGHSEDSPPPTGRGNVPTLLESISSFRGRNDLGTNRDDRLDLLEQARKLVHALETPRELMLKHIGAETASFFSIALGIDVGLLKALVLHQGKPKKVKETVGIIGFDVDGLSRILRHLAAMGHIENTGPDEYAPNNFSKALTIPVIADGYLFYRETCIPSMLHLHSWLKSKAFQTPTTVIDNPFTFGQRTSTTMFEFMAIEPHRMEHFNHHMGGYRLGRPSWFEPSVYPAQERLLAAAPDSPNSDAAVLVDIGGNKGHDLERFLSYFPSVAKGEDKGKFILQDTAPVLAEAPSDLNSLIEKQPHDFFTPQPVHGARAYYLHHILHDWPDAKCEVIVKQIRRSMKKGYSKLLINEHVIPAVGANWEATYLDLYMMVQFGSRERTEEEWKVLLEEKCGMRIVGIWNPGNGVEAVIECEI